MIAAILLAIAQPASVTQVRDAYPHLSPDGRTLVFHSNRTGRQAIWVTNGDGSDPRLLFDGGALGSDPGTPVWSPDGRQIAFAMRPSGATDENESEIYVMRADGSQVRRITNAPGDDSHPHWSADGTRIFFNSARATPDLRADWARQWHDIYSVAANGRDLRRHTDCRSVCTYPVPSPNGRAVVHRCTTDSPGHNWDQSPARRNSEICVTPLTGGSARNVTNHPGYDGWPAWSPDGRWLVFASSRDKLPRVGQIYAVRPDGSGLRRLTSGSISRVQPSFSADGKRLLVYENVETAEFEIGHIARLEVSLEE